RPARRGRWGRLRAPEAPARGRGGAPRPPGHAIPPCLDFIKADQRFIRSLLTIVGEMLWWELNGEPVQPLHVNRPPHKSLARGGSIGQSTADPDRLYAWLDRDVERLREGLGDPRGPAGRPGRCVGF